MRPADPARAHRRFIEIVALALERTEQEDRERFERIRALPKLRLSGRQQREKMRTPADG
jgi:hypothetical protein